MDSPIGSFLLLITLLTTYNGFIRRDFFEKYLFQVDKILYQKERYRLFSSGFLHANWLHFGFNMIALISFSWALEFTLGYLSFLLIYFVAMLGGNLLALYIHRNHGDYSAIGASGAISGVVMSSIVLFPESKIGIILLPFIEFPSWIFGLLFIVVSLFGIKSQRDNIGHEAHLGGAITGLILTVLIRPSIALSNWWVILLMLVPTVGFLWLIIKHPDFLITGKFRKPNLKIVHSKVRSKSKHNKTAKTQPRLNLK